MSLEKSSDVWVFAPVFFHGFSGQKLNNVKPLGSLMRLVAVDFSGCDALQDVTPLLGGGYDPPADSMADLLLGFSWLECQAVFSGSSSNFPDT